MMAMEFLKWLVMVSLDIMIISPTKASESLYSMNPAYHMEDDVALVWGKLEPSPTLDLSSTDLGLLAWFWAKAPHILREYLYW
jgi:hypothetical protein